MGERPLIECRMPSGRVSVTACVVRRGLALHPHPELAGTRSWWTLTHVASGLAVLQWIPTRAEGERLLGVLLGFGDWTRDATTLHVDRRLSARVRALKSSREASASASVR